LGRIDFHVFVRERLLAECYRSSSAAICFLPDVCGTGTLFSYSRFVRKKKKRSGLQRNFPGDRLAGIQCDADCSVNICCDLPDLLVQTSQKFPFECIKSLFDIDGICDSFLLTANSHSNGFS